MLAHVVAESELLKLQKRLTHDVGAFLELLEAIVNIDSGTFDKVGVDAVSAILQAEYRESGATIQLYPNDAYGDTFTATFQGTGTGRILLLGHLDTVYPLGAAVDRPFRIEGQRAIGPGTADMKAGDLSILFALRALIQDDFRHFAEVCILHNSDEEIGSPSSRELIKSCSRSADAVLVLEAGRENGNIVSARKGIAAYVLSVSGVAAHSGVNHHRGRSAALELCNLVIQLEALNGRLPDTTINVGQLGSGSRPNVVPDTAFARFEARAFDPDYLHQVEQLVREIVGRRTVEGTEATIEVRSEHAPMHRTPSSERLVRLAQQLAASLGFSLKDTATGGASDGNTAAAAGRPVLDGLGPIGGSAHSPAEYIEIESIAPRTALLAGLISHAGMEMSTSGTA